MQKKEDLGKKKLWQYISFFQSKTVKFFSSQIPKILIEQSFYILLLTVQEHHQQLGLFLDFMTYTSGKNCPFLTRTGFFVVVMFCPCFLFL